MMMMMFAAVRKMAATAWRRHDIMITVNRLMCFHMITEQTMIHLQLHLLATSEQEVAPDGDRRHRETPPYWISVIDRTLQLINN